jgi:hypothetical protein
MRVKNILFRIYPCIFSACEIKVLVLLKKYFVF